jgi:hypothetical protein
MEHVLSVSKGSDRSRGFSRFRLKARLRCPIYNRFVYMPADTQRQGDSMEQYQYLLLAVLVVGAVSYIVASSQNRAPTGARPVLPPEQPHPVRPRSVSRQPPVSPQPRRPSSPPITPAKPTPRKSVPSTSTRASTGAATIPQTSRPSSARASAQAATMAEQQAYRALLVRAQGDHARAERLIAYEQTRDPHGTRLIWIQSAITSFEHDNR